MTSRLYLDNYYKEAIGQRIPYFDQLKAAEDELVLWLDENFPNEWRFGSITYISDVKRCIYFEKDELATMFVIKSGIQCRVVYER